MATKKNERPVTHIKAVDAIFRGDSPVPLRGKTDAQLNDMLRTARENRNPEMQQRIAHEFHRRKLEDKSC